MLDDYLWGHIERISPEAPVPILNVVRRESTLGGAGNVVENLRGLGVHVVVLGVVGEDETGNEIRNLLDAHGADVRGLLSDANRRSTRKSRLMSLEHGQQVFRLDEESTCPIGGGIEDCLIQMIRAVTRDVQIIVCSDYMKGVLTDRVLTGIFAFGCESGITSVVAPKDSRPQKYLGASILVPNARELGQLVGTPVDGEIWLNDSGQQLIQRMGLEALLVTRGGEGMSLFERSNSGFRRVDIPTVARSVYDVTGAGDTAIAAFAAGLASGLDRETAAHLANFAAGIKVGKRGTACISCVELLECIRNQLEPRRELALQSPHETTRAVVDTAAPRAGVF
jgi:D-beta-D-heptose 7-phosphate kinase / D-beta-D-heptose 1-phosphate adenosyltransferase